MIFCRSVYFFTVLRFQLLKRYWRSWDTPLTVAQVLTKSTYNLISHAKAVLQVIKKKKKKILSQTALNIHLIILSCHPVVHHKFWPSWTDLRYGAESFDTTPNSMDQKDTHIRLSSRMHRLHISDLFSTPREEVKGEGWCGHVIDKVLCQSTLTKEGYGQ